MVDTQLIRFTHALSGRRVAYLTPAKVQAYVVAFDAGDPIPPFSFWLNDPIPMRQRALTDEGKRRALARNDKLKGKPKQPRKPRTTVPDIDDTVSLEGLATPPLAPVTPGERVPPLVFRQRGTRVTT